jgi:biopolymer transport protein ExbD
VGRRHHYRRRTAAPIEPDMTTFLNLMVVLVPFLLITAVFSRITIVELSLPTSASGGAATEPSLRVEVIVREDGLQISDGRAVIASLPKRDGEYDLDRLSDLILALKQDNPDKNDASVLLEPQIEYDHLIQVMDVVRSAETPDSGDLDDADHDSDQAKTTQRVALFTDIAIGDAP